MLGFFESKSSLLERLTTILWSAIETIRPLIGQYGHELTVTLPNEPISVKGDSNRLGQVFLNLLNHAAEFSRRPARSG